VYSLDVRYLGVDAGRKRIGLAVSDPSGLVARPWRMVEAGHSPRVSADRVAALLDELRDPLDDSSGVAGIVIGLPRRLDGSDNEMTASARALASALHSRTGMEVHLQDERLTSLEADQRLAEREPDWRQRKLRLDAASAAIILQDFLDQRRTRIDGANDGRASA
jgi:putative Holliday junction resolvase